MSTSRRRGAERGLTLIEVLVAFGLLAIGLVGLTAGLVTASKSNGRAFHRTQMVEFAQSRIERLTAASRKNICTATSSSGPVSCSGMGNGTFSTTAAPNTNGWIADLLDRATVTDPLALASSSTYGVDVMAGPALVFGSTTGSNNNAVDDAATISKRTAIAADANGCASSLVTADTLCREIHIEDQSTTVGAQTLKSYHIWVRVIRGGGNYLDGMVVLEGSVAQ
ncbi:MAG: prepilin-type N-terminal cleavage/methylation domain-containing protein [Deltaproteobacteria bacterium]|nr:prepilin-type N-terminal cleavage/methylation domain-containing protein [Deltaproteobacteria bacterium]